MKLIFLDTENSGLNPLKHRIIDIAFKIFDTRTSRLVISYESLITQPPEVWAEADPMSLKITDLSWEESLKGKAENVVAEEIINDFNHAKIREKKDVFICQNPSADRAFFNQMIPPSLQEGYHWPYHWLDLASMYWAYRLLKDKNSYEYFEKEGLSKDKIAHFFHILPEKRPHRAMNGVNHLIDCYEALFGKFATQAAFP